MWMEQQFELVTKDGYVILVKWGAQELGSPEEGIWRVEPFWAPRVTAPSGEVVVDGTPDDETAHFACGYAVSAMQVGLQVVELHRTDGMQGVLVLYHEGLEVARKWASLPRD